MPLDTPLANAQGLPGAAGLAGSLPGLNAAATDTSGGATSAPPPIPSQELAATLARMPAMPGGDTSPAGGVPLPDTSAAAPTPFAPPPGVSALGSPGTNPFDHMSFATALNLAFNPGALQIMAHLQGLKHQQNIERLQNMQFNEMLKEHARSAEEHAASVKNAQAEFESRLYQQGAKKLPAGAAPDSEHQVLHTAFGDYQLPTADERAEQAKAMRAKETVTVPDPNNPDKQLEWPADKIDKYPEAVRKAATGEPKETKTLTKDDGHQYYQIVGKESGKIYHETDAGKAIAGEREQDVKQKQTERQQAVLEKRQKVVGDALDKFNTLKGQAMALNDDQVMLDRKYTAAQQSWNEAKDRYYTALKSGADPKDPATQDAYKNMNNALKEFQSAKDAADKNQIAKARAWANAHSAHAGLRRYGELNVQGTGSDEPVADWKPGMEPGGAAEQAGTTPAAAAPATPTAPAAGGKGVIPAASLQQIMTDHPGTFKSVDEVRQFVTSQGYAVQ